MLKTFTIAISLGALGLLAGACLPALVAYSILYVRRNGRQLRTFLRLGGILLAALFVIGGIVNLVLISLDHLNDLDFDSRPYFIGIRIGFWGSIVALVIGFRRGRRNRGATQARGSQS
jgi:hypothetical protein